MQTVLFNRQSNWISRLALLWGGVAIALVPLTPLVAQELGTLRGDAEEAIFWPGNRTVATGTTQAIQTSADTSGIPSPAYQPYNPDAAVEKTAKSADDFQPIDLQTTATTPVAKLKLNADVLAGQSVAGRALPAPAAGAVQGGGAAPDEDPYAAVGLRFGSFILKPTVELGLTGSRETTASESGAPPVVSQSTANTLLGDSALRLQLDSDWDRHALSMTAVGRLQRTLYGGDDLEPALSLDASGRMDIGANTRLTATFGYDYQLDDPQSAAFYAATDPLIVPAVTGSNKPATQTLDGSLALRHEFGRLYGEAEISATRSLYGLAELSDASSLSQADLNNSVYDGRLRAGFEVSPVLSPFMEASYGVRRMDATPDTGGLNRNATRYALRVGTGIDLGEKLNGEISAGYIREDIVDAALEDIAGVAVDATFSWSPRRETDVSLGLSTSTEASGGSGESGALLYAANLGVTHRVRANLTAEAGFGAEYRDARGSADETTFTGQAALTYWFNRFAGLTTRIGHEQTLSTDPSKRTGTTTAFVGLRLQR